MQSGEEVRATLEAAADVVLGRPEIVGLTCPDRPDVCHGGRRYSTAWTLQTEQAVLDVIHAGRDSGVAVASTYRVLAEAGVAEDQANAVRRICTGGERVAVLVGPAGSGKSRTLAAARQAWEQAGFAVRGVAPSAVAAGVLTEQAGIPSETLAKFLLDAAHGSIRIRPGEVIVCDEASMVSTRDLAQLVLHAEAADAKVVLVGDHYQLGSVDAGGLFRLLATDARTAALTGVRRFADPWEAQATRRLRDGDPTVIDEYVQHGRVSAGERDQAVDAAHQAWLQAREEGSSVVVMAADHDTVDRLAMRARAARVTRGQVEPGGITLANQTVGIGDEIVTTRNDRRLVTTTGGWVRNGDRWQITERCGAGSLQLESLDGRGKVTVAGDYVQENVALAYAVTVHKAQGITTDQAVLVVDRATAAEHLYVGMTRGRHRNQACVVTEASGDEHQRRETPAGSDVLTGAMRKTSNEKSATETLRDEFGNRSQSNQQAILAGLRESHAHGLQQTIRREIRWRAFTATPTSPAPGPSVYQGIDL